MKLTPLTPEQHLAHDENDSHLVPTVDFDWDDLADRLQEVDDAKHSHGYSQFLLVQKFGEGISRWIYQDPTHTNTEGIAIRAIIVCWFLIRELQPLNLTQLSRMYGKDKQSFGRWADEFKRKFPGVRNCHMKE